MLIEATICWLNGLNKQKRSGLKAASLSNQMNVVGYGLHATSMSVTSAAAIVPEPSALPPPVTTQFNIVVLLTTVTA